MCLLESGGFLPRKALAGEGKRRAGTTWDGKGHFMTRLLHGFLSMHHTGRNLLDMRGRGARTRSTLGLAGFLLVLVAALGAQAEPPSFTLPGRKPDSRVPWGAFVGKRENKRDAA
ncbi:hypothetical protein BON30_13870 [Cystobacter ferrugineus]|uniref:Uncharacterized protein n=1 Tax=Cystobacter ferrugineus TaxID=83449 RepID=A0A1L9BD03_9BACT|nr:hypothetical protein BON30_13870 [Cystobacter ferrugineus]